MERQRLIRLGCGFRHYATDLSGVFSTDAGLFCGFFFDWWGGLWGVVLEGR